MSNYDLLLSAAQKNQPDRIRQLVEQQGVPVNHSNAVGQSALHIACLWGHGACE
jgi:ankyrin repeat protein